MNIRVSALSVVLVISCLIGCGEATYPKEKSRASSYLAPPAEPKNQFVNDSVASTGNLAAETTDQMLEIDEKNKRFTIAGVVKNAINQVFEDNSIDYDDFKRRDVDAHDGVINWRDEDESEKRGWEIAGDVKTNMVQLLTEEAKARLHEHIVRAGPEYRFLTTETNVFGVFVIDPIVPTADEGSLTPAGQTPQGTQRKFKVPLAFRARWNPTRPKEFRYSFMPLADLGSDNPLSDLTISAMHNPDNMHVQTQYRIGEHLRTEAKIDFDHGSGEKVVNLFVTYSASWK